MQKARRLVPSQTSSHEEILFVFQGMVDDPSMEFLASLFARSRTFKPPNAQIETLLEEHRRNPQKWRTADHFMWDLNMVITKAERNRAEARPLSQRQPATPTVETPLGVSPCPDLVRSPMMVGFPNHSLVWKPAPLSGEVLLAAFGRPDDPSGPEINFPTTRKHSRGVPRQTFLSKGLGSPRRPVDPGVVYIKPKPPSLKSTPRGVNFTGVFKSKAEIKEILRLSLTTPP